MNTNVVFFCIHLYELYKFTSVDGVETDSSSDPYVCLPYARLISVDEVLLSGEVSTDYLEVDTLPAQLYFDTATYSHTNGIPVLVATYTAGYGAIADVPQAIKSAVSMMAAYMYEHRGSCDSTSALDQSGAAMALTPYKTSVVIL